MVSLVWPGRRHGVPPKAWELVDLALGKPEQRLSSAYDFVPEQGSLHVVVEPSNPMIVQSGESVEHLWDLIVATECEQRSAWFQHPSRIFTHVVEDLDELPRVWRISKDQVDALVW